MEKDSEKKIWDGPVTESKPDPVYQGGYTDGYEAGEQYGYLSGWNEALETIKVFLQHGPDPNDFQIERVIDRIKEMKK